MDKMKISAGFGSCDDYDKLCDAGADELYCGFVPFEWLNKYGNILPMNRREVYFCGMQLDSFGEMRRLREKIERRNVPVSLTFNSLYYAPEQYEILTGLLDKLIGIGFDRFIIADLGLAWHIRQNKLQCNLMLSGECGEYNRLSMEFYKRFGFSRYIFRRNMSVSDMAECRKVAPEAEYEAFMLNERCRYTGAFCFGLHCDELPYSCRLNCRTNRIGDKNMKDDMQKSTCSPDGFGAGGCGICAMEKLKNAGITHLKVVGRGAHIENIERDVRILREIIDGNLKVDKIRADCAINCYYRKDEMYE